MTTFQVIQTRLKINFSIVSILSFLQKQLIFSVPGAMLLGVLVGYFFEVSALQKIILPVTILMVYPIMVTFNIQKLFGKGDMRLIIVTTIINFVLVPAAGYMVGTYFFSDNLPMRIGLMLIALIPTSGMTITWTGIAKGNVPGAIRITVLGLLLGAVLTPFYLKFLLGEVIAIPVSRIIIQIGIVVFIPLVLGYFTQQQLLKKYGTEKFQKEIKPKFPPFSTLGVLIMVFVALALKSKAILANPEILLKILIPLVLFYALVFFITTIKAKAFFTVKDAVAMVYGSAMRNLSIALAIAMTVFKEAGADIALIIALAYIVQVQGAVWYMKLIPRTFK